MSIAELKERIEKEKAAALKKARKDAIAKHKAAPTKLNPDWQNTMVELCQAQLKHLDATSTSVQPIDESTSGEPPGGSDTELSELPSDGGQGKSKPNTSKSSGRAKKIMAKTSKSKPVANRQAKTRNADQPTEKPRKSVRLDKKQQSKLSAIEKEDDVEDGKSSEDEESGEGDGEYNDEGESKQGDESGEKREGKNEPKNHYCYEREDEGDGSEDDDTPRLSHEEWPKRHGRLSKTETQEIREEGKKLMTTIIDTAKKYRISSGTVMEIMELGVTGRRRNPNVWNMFEAIYFHELFSKKTEDVEGEESGGTITSALDKRKPSQAIIV
jgi:hypothetical protein